MLPSLQEACHVCVAIWAQAFVLLPLGMAERSATLRRINDFRRSKAHCSASALAQILKDIKDNGVPELTDRRDFREARDLVVTAEGHYGPILQSIECVANEGPARHIPIASPFAVLHSAVTESDSFRALLKSNYSFTPESREALE